MWCPTLYEKLFGCLIRGRDCLPFASTSVHLLPLFFGGEGGSVLFIFLVFCVASGVSGLSIPDCPSVFSNVYWIKRTIEIYSDLFSPMIRPSYITPWDSKKIFPVKDFDLYLSVIQLLQEILYNYAVVGKVVVEIEKHSIVNLKIVQCK